MYKFNYLLLATLFSFGFFSISNNAKAEIQKKISFKLQNVTLHAVFQKIEKSFNCDFAYAHEEVNDEIIVNIDVEDGSLEEVLQELFNDIPYAFDIAGDKVIIKKALLKEKIQQDEKRVLKGYVTAENKEPLPFVNVYIKNTTIGTVTDEKGYFELTVDDASQKTIVASSIGYQTQEIIISEATQYNFTLIDAMSQVDEVVVTANNIQKEKRSLGYAIATLDGDMVNKSQDANVLNNLSGKVAGLKVINQSGNIGSSTRVQIRGISSLTGDNQPLFVVDGVPISNSNYSGANNDRNSGYDPGNRAADINADDIETISVLKGGAAAAIYGSRAKDGVIIITTKRGKKQSNAKIFTYNGSFGLSSVLKLPDLQNEFTQGTDGHYVNTSLNGWGASIASMAGKTVKDINGNDVLLSAQPNNIQDFFDVGQFLHNSLSISEAGEDHDYRLSFTNFNQKGIIPNSELNKSVLSFNAGKNFSSKWTSRITFNYYRQKVEGQVSSGTGNNSLINILYQIPRTFSLDEYKQYKNVDGSQKKLDQFTNNPYWIINENTNEGTLDRIIGNFQVGYDPYEWLNFTARVGTDFYREYRRNILAMGTVGVPKGAFSDESIYSRELNTDVMATINKDFSTDLNLTMILGHNVNQRQFQTISNIAKNLTVADLYTFSNAEINNPSNYYSIRRLWGAYADMTLSYKNFAFLNGTLRNDNSSTLPKENNSYWYYSMNSSLILTDALPSLKKDWLTYAKLRANYSQVGSDEAPYQLKNQYAPLSQYFVQFQAGNFNTFPHGGYLAFRAPAEMAPENLKPQKKNELEIGLDIYFLNHRCGFEVAHYISKTKNQIISIPVPWTSGYESKRTNIGEIENKGIELKLNVVPIQTNDFKWDVLFNFSKNKTTVVELAQGVEELTLLSSANNLSIKARPGEGYGLYGLGYKRNDAGEPIVNKETGFYEIADTPMKFGEIEPDFLMGLSNTFRYKNLTFSVMIDGRKGGVMYSNTVNNLRRDGLASETAANRDKTMILNGVNEVDGKYVSNTVPMRSVQDYWEITYGSKITEPAIFESDYIKLREARLNFGLPQKWVNKTPFGKVNLAVYGNNLFLIYSKIPHIDPESSQYGSSAMEGIEYGGVPSTRNYGFNVQMTF